MDEAYKTETIEHDGHSFSVSYFPYDLGSTPWEWSDSHGTVSDWTGRDKRPGEVVLRVDGRLKRFYNMQGAIKTAKADGWDCAEVLPTDTHGQKAVKAARSDFEYLKGWCDGDWWHCCLHVILLDSEGNEIREYDDYLGGLEDGYKKSFSDYVKSTALEMAGEILRRYKADQNALLISELHQVKDHALFMTGVI